MDINTIKSILGLLTQLAPILPTTGAVGSVIKTISDITPVLLQTYEDVSPSIMGVINALRANPETTAKQFDDLKLISAKVDKDFDDAVKNQD